MLFWDAFYNYYADFKNHSNSSNERERKRTFVKTFVKKELFHFKYSSEINVFGL